MLETIISICIKYWIEFLFGIVVAGGGLFLKNYTKLLREERHREQKEYYEKLTEGIKKENKETLDSLVTRYNKIENEVEERYKEITTNIDEIMIKARAESKYDDEILQKQIDDMSKEMGYIKNGLLSLQGRKFREQCRKLLQDDHEITLDEWEEIDADHEAYNGLGGNHKGDQLFNLVRKKVENSYTDIK